MLIMTCGTGLDELGLRSAESVLWHFQLVILSDISSWNFVILRWLARVCLHDHDHCITRRQTMTSLSSHRVVCQELAQGSYAVRNWTSGVDCIAKGI